MSCDRAISCMTARVGQVPLDLAVSMHRQQIGGSLNASISQTDAELFSDPFAGFADSITCLARNEEAAVGRHLPTMGPALLRGPAPLYRAPRSAKQLAAAFRVDTACGRLLTEVEEVEDAESVPE